MALHESSTEAGDAGPGGAAHGGRLFLFGHAPQPAVLVVERRPEGQRLKRAAVRLVLCWLAIPVVGLVPPHVPWVLIALVAGPYLARREWIGDYVVQRFDGRCPSCHAPLELAAGSNVRLPTALHCPGCRRQVRLEATDQGN